MQSSGPSVSHHCLTIQPKPVQEEITSTYDGTEIVAAKNARELIPSIRSGTTTLKIIYTDGKRDFPSRKLLLGRTKDAVAL